MGTLYDTRKAVKAAAINPEDLHKIVYNIQEAIEALCEKLDADGGVTDTDYESAIATKLTASIPALATPKQGPTRTI